MIFTHIGFDNPDSGDILLYDSVKRIVPLEYLDKELGGAFDQEKQAGAQDNHRHQENEAQPAVDKKAHEQAENHVERCPETDSQQHLECSLDIADISCHPRDKPCGGILVYVGE